MSSALNTAGAQPLEYLAFTIGTEEYGVDIQKVQELRGYDAVTKIANAPDYIKGVVNLRGIIVPIVDMRMKLGNPTPSYDQFTVVVILTIGATIMGMVVDSVSDVTTLKPEEIKPAPDMGGGVDSRYLVGIGAVEERMLLLVDIDRMMSADDLGTLQQLAAA